MLEENKSIEKGVLYLVATPIGNLGDITYRAVETLKNVDFIAAEDTRRTLTLLNHLGISKPMTSYFEHNIRQKGEYITERILSGESVALVTDAGTPAISDPGEDIVKICIEKNIKVVPVPGAVAGIQALICSGFSTQRFSFEGFLSMNRKNRIKHLEEVKNSPYTLIFYEAPHKLKNTLSDMLSYFGNRRIVLARELTKKFEEIKQTTLADAVSFYEENPPKGEFVLVVEGTDSADQENELNSLELGEHLRYYISNGETKKDAIKLVARDRGVPKREIYEQAINIEI